MIKPKKLHSLIIKAAKGCFAADPTEDEITAMTNFIEMAVLPNWIDGYTPRDMARHMDAFIRRNNLSFPYESDK